MTETLTSSVIRAMISHWETSTLDTEIRSRRSNPAAVQDTLHEDEAEPLTPRPYVIFEQAPGGRNDHQSWSTTEGRELRNTFFRFSVHAGKKSDAADIAALILSRYNNQTICPSDSPIVSCRLQGEGGVRLGDDEWLWNLNFEVVFDAPSNP